MPRLWRANDAMSLLSRLAGSVTQDTVQRLRSKCVPLAKNLRKQYGADTRVELHGAPGELPTSGGVPH